MASIALPARRHGFPLKLGLAIALVAAGDLLFYQRGEFGASIGLFALGWIAITIAGSPALRRRPDAWVAVGVAALASAALVFDPGLLAWAIFWVALSMAALIPATASFDDGWQWFQRLFMHGLRSLAGPLVDAWKLRRARRGRQWLPRLGAMLPTLVLPVAGSAVILLLFAIANPLISEMLAAIRLPAVSPQTIVRAIFWGMLFTLVWGTLRPRRISRVFAPFDGSGDLAMAGVSITSVTLSLILFNALFAFQNALDIAYLWGGLALPEGMTLAQYAHRGAYPLIATALLAGLFVIVTLRPGSATATDPLIRRLLVLWIAQNVFLVASTILRTLDYVDAYSLTRLRIAALAWMGLVAVGLVLICWRMLREKSTGWLINANLAATGGVLLLFCFVDTGAMAAAWNVRHAREAGGRGAQLDLCYLEGLGSSALVPLVELEQRRLDPDFIRRVRIVRQQVMDHTLAAQAHGWTIRNARRLDLARARLGGAPDPRPLGVHDCHGRFVPPPPPLPETEAAPAIPAPSPTPLTGEAQR